MSETFHFLRPVDPEVSEAMGTAFETAWTSLRSSELRLSAQEACDARIRLAQTIIDQVRRGERNATKLCQYALASVAAGTPEVGQ